MKNSVDPYLSGRLWSLEFESAKLQLLNTQAFRQLTVKNGWVKNAHGTKMVDLGEKILVFYRDEKSTKVGQICKNDEGGDDRNRDLMRNHFLTYTSTRMICDEVYTNLVDVKLITIDNQQLLMTIFATSEKSLPGTLLL